MVRNDFRSTRFDSSFCGVFFFFGEAFLQFVVEGIGLKKVVKYDIRKDI